ncbi:MAG TPA: winged helix-turn-helix transcriptional regulator [Myxococcota bacterium]|jgi:DNA-binding HxlR family transcriptional regulator
MAKRISRKESDGARRPPRGAGTKRPARRGGDAARATARAEIPRPAAIFDPVARALDWLGDKWTLVLVRHLLLAPCGFQELRRRTGIAPRVLSARLRQLQADGLVAREDGERGIYAVTKSAHDLAPVVSALARWYVLHAVEDLELDLGRFSETSAQSILESLPFLLREDRAQGVHLVFEIRLTGAGGGVWSVAIDDGACRVALGFAANADVRYTAETRVWCAVALGFLDPRDARKRGLLQKEGGREALDHFFHQIARPRAEGATR